MRAWWPIPLSPFQRPPRATVRLPRIGLCSTALLTNPPSAYGSDGRNPYQRCQAMRVKGLRSPSGAVAIRLPLYRPHRPPWRPGKPPTPEFALAISERSMANDLAVASINARFTVTDSGPTYNRCFTRSADIGDGWFGVAVNDHLASSARRTSLVHNGPMLTTFRIRTTMRPILHLDTMTRAEIFAGWCRQHRQLSPADHRVQTTVHNNIVDHQLRAVPQRRADRDPSVDSAFDVASADNHSTASANGLPKKGSHVHDADRGLVVPAVACWNPPCATCRSAHR